MAYPKTKVTRKQRDFIKKHYKPYRYSIARLIREIGLSEWVILRVIKENVK